jgi:hypothetical protein
MRVRTQPLSSLTGWPPPFASISAAETERPKRARRMILILTDQIDEQRRVAIDLCQASFDGADVVAGELERQATELGRVRASIEAGADRINAGAPAMGAEIVSAIESSGGRICASVLEFEWQVEQQARLLREVSGAHTAGVAREAEEYVGQGLRHYLFEQYGDAKERLLRGLKLDSTNHRALLTVGFIYAHEGNSDAALDSIERSWQLPVGLTKADQLVTLRALTRLHHDRGEFDQACSKARASVELSDAQADSYLLAACLVAAGRPWAEVAPFIRRAATYNLELFARAAIDRRFFHYQSDVRRLLAEVAQDARAELARRAQQVSKQVAELYREMDEVAVDA